MDVQNENPLDIWLKFENESDEEPTYEANTFQTEDGFRVEWYHVNVGQAAVKTFTTYREAEAWLESEGFLDFTS